MIICNNRKKCGIKICTHYLLHEKGDCCPFSHKGCSGFGCSSKCGQERECVDEFIDIVKQSIKKENKNGDM